MANNFSIKSLLNNIWVFVVPPGAAMVATPFYMHDAFLVTLIWGVSLLMIGLHASVGLRECEGLLCYVRGPFFILGSILTILHGTSLMYLGLSGYRWIGYAMIAGAIGLNLIPMMWDWRKRRSQSQA